MFLPIFSTCREAQNYPNKCNLCAKGFLILIWSSNHCIEFYSTFKGSVLHTSCQIKGSTINHPGWGGDKPPKNKSVRTLLRTKLIHSRGSQKKMFRGSPKKNNNIWRVTEKKIDSWISAPCSPR